MGLDDIVDKAKDVAGDAADKVKDVAGDVKDRAGDAADAVKEDTAVWEGVVRPTTDKAWLELLDRGATSGVGSKGRMWALDPIDGTKGFLRQGQYACCLGLIEDGQVVLGAMGCPNLPVDFAGKGEGEKGEDPVKAIEERYKKDETDEFLKPIIVNGDAGRVKGRFWRRGCF